MRLHCPVYTLGQVACQGSKSIFLSLFACAHLQDGDGFTLAIKVVKRVEITPKNAQHDA